MSSPGSPALRGLHRLDKSSPDFGNQLNDMLYEEEYIRRGESLGCDDLVWLVDYLDEVCCRLVLSRSPLKQI